MSSNHLIGNTLRSAARTAVLASALVCAGAAAAAYTLQEFTFDSPAQERTFRDLTSKLRCLVCQNESLAGSQADLAQDLRKEVYGMLREGKSQDEIITFLVDRYGDFVLYQPQVKPSTYLLWFGPFVLIGVGGWLLLRALKAKKAEPEPETDAAERARLHQLLAATEPPDQAK
ncbi:cytochrome c-type biogenesis protein [uncultured Lamprocystis sp.]|uniref:cytochrome c-type biogenesis protein n=1 Tax=uncultured Lamprocystis sp. TaxID=543132 RepID=UPI0025D43561|nr:cytochrome c-type biogenesis protein [uncultured Lamprocystis sp.]